MKPVKIGIIQGAGTGEEQVAIFKNYLSGIARKNGVVLHFQEVRDKAGKVRVFHSYATIKAIEENEEAQDKAQSAQKISAMEVEELTDIIDQWYRAGIRTIFRTSINAEALYLFRQRVKAVKEIRIRTSNNRRILILRDQAEGYYANDPDYTVSEEAIHFSGQFTKAHTQSIAAYARRAGEELFGKYQYEIWAVYKNHLFGSTLEQWLQNAPPSLEDPPIKTFDPPIQAYQPDTGFTKLFDYLKYEQKKDLVLITSNEVGDLIYEPLMEYINIQSKLDLYSKNIYLSPVKDNSLPGVMTEYQTVHGSADNIAGKDELHPYAVLRIGAAIAEVELGIAHARQAMDRVVVRAKLTYGKNLHTQTVLKNMGDQLGLELTSEREPTVKTPSPSH